VITSTVTGNVGRDPETRNTKSGKPMVSFSVASTTRKEGREPETTWIDVLCFDELALGVCEQLHKGAKVVVTGQMALEQYEKKDGTPGHSLRLIANEVAVSLRAAKNYEEDEPKFAKKESRDSRQPW
jgi:single-strand DNA-binding protein